MKNSDLFTFAEGLRSVGDLCGPKFVYAVAKNARIVQVEVDALQAGMKFSEAAQKYDEERVSLCKKYALENGNGEPKVNGQEYEIDPACRADFDSALKQLRIDHKSAVDERQKQIDEFNALMDEDTAIELHKVSREHIPENITAAQMGVIFDMIEE